LIGSYNYKLNDLAVKKTISEEIKNSPDPSAQIIFEIQAVFNSNAN